MKKLKISDIAVFDRIWEDGRLVVLSEGDHLLRRFGQVCVQKFKAGEATKEALNNSEDEIWTLISGRGKLRMIDVREGSPSFNEIVEIEMNEDHPVSILIPFGLKFFFIAEIEAEIIQVRTHQE